MLHDTGVGRDPAVAIWINNEEPRPASGDARLLLITAIGGTDTGSTVICRGLGGGDPWYCQDKEDDSSSHGRT